MRTRPAVARRTCDTRGAAHPACRLALIRSPTPTGRGRKTPTVRIVSVRLCMAYWPGQAWYAGLLERGYLRREPSAAADCGRPAVRVSCALRRQLACPQPRIRTHTRVWIAAQTWYACYGSRIGVVKVMLAVFAERSLCGRPLEGPLWCRRFWYRGNGRFSTTLFMTRVELRRWTPGRVARRLS